MWDAPPATLAGVPDTQVVRHAGSQHDKAFKVTVGYPSLGSVAVNGFDYTATVTRRRRQGRRHDDRKLLGRRRRYSSISAR